MLSQDAKQAHSQHGRLITFYPSKQIHAQLFDAISSAGNQERSAFLRRNPSIAKEPLIW
jgi:hypothetical protein